MIRPYRNSDFEMICNWWTSHNEPSPQLGMMVEDGTFIYEYNGQPILSLTVFITQSSIGYFEGYISNPEINKEIRNKCGEKLWKHCFEYAEKRNIKYLLAYTDKSPLVKRYESFGMTKCINNLTGLIRNLGV